MDKEKYDPSKWTAADESEITLGKKKYKKMSKNPLHMDDDSEVSLP